MQLQTQNLPILLPPVERMSVSFIHSKATIKLEPEPGSYTACPGPSKGIPASVYGPHPLFQILYNMLSPMQLTLLLPDLP